jgi:hypothetical protein
MYSPAVAECKLGTQGLRRGFPKARQEQANGITASRGILSWR